MAPEIFSESPYTSKTDVFAFAIIMWETFSEKTPYYFLSNPQSIIKYVYYEKGRPHMKDLKAFTPPGISELIERNWNQEPENRMEFREIISELKSIEANLAD